MLSAQSVLLKARKEEKAKSEKQKRNSDRGWLLKNSKEQFF
jgi:hypothetical protein